MQYTPRVVEPAFERREEWEILSDLALACRAPVLGKTFLNPIAHINRWLARWSKNLSITPDHMLAVALRLYGGLSLKTIQQHPHGMLLPPIEPGRFWTHQVRWADRKVRLAPDALMADLKRVHDDAKRRSVPDDRLVMIGRRERRTHNSWMHNHSGIRRTESPFALLHPTEGHRRNISDGEEIEIRGQGQRIVVPVRLTPTVVTGVIVVPHGWGHETRRLTRAHRLKGGNVNRIMAGGVQHMEPVSGQAIMTAHPVTIRPLKRTSTSTEVRAVKNGALILSLIHI